MPTEYRNMLITIPFIIFLVLMFFWLIKALMPGSRDLSAKYTKDKYQQAGYETMTDIKRKEYSVIGGGIAVMVVCLAIMGALSYMVFSAGISAALEDQMGFNLILIFIPALVLMGFVIAASISYMKRQQVVLNEFRTFRTTRDKAIKEYQEKRSGKDKEQTEKSPAKKTPSARQPDISGAVKAGKRHGKKIPSRKKKT